MPDPFQQDLDDLSDRLQEMKARLALLIEQGRLVEEITGQPLSEVLPEANEAIAYLTRELTNIAFAAQTVTATD